MSRTFQCTDATVMPRMLRISPSRSVAFGTFLNGGPPSDLRITRIVAQSCSEIDYTRLPVATHNVYI